MKTKNAIQERIAWFQNALDQAREDLTRLILESKIVSLERAIGTDCEDRVERVKQLILAQPEAQYESVKLAALEAMKESFEWVVGYN